MPRLTIEKVDDDLKRRFKIWCLSNRTTMRDELVKHIEATLAKAETRKAK